MAWIHPSLSIKGVPLEMSKHGQGERQKLTTLPYEGSNQNVWAVKDFLEKHLVFDLSAAWVHGSLATNDEVAYSDFDGLIVIKNEVFADARRCRRVLTQLNKSLQYLRKQDMLQHHGWMLLNENDLLNYDPNFLPLETLECSRSLLGNSSVQLDLILSKNPGSSQSINGLMNSVLAKLGHPRMYQSAYFLKVMLSEFMLLPAMLWQVLNEKGIYKRDSFGLVKPLFTAKEWESMVTASSIRKSWPNYTSGLVSWVNTWNTTLASEIAKKKSWPIPDTLKKRLDELFFESARLFIAKCQLLITDETH